MVTGWSGVARKIEPRPEPTGEAGHFLRRLCEDLQELGGQRVEQVGITRAFVEDHELVVPGLPVQTTALGQLPARFGSVG